MRKFSIKRPLSMLCRLPKKLLVIPLAISLIGCAANTTETARPTVVHDYCLIAKPITFSEAHGTDVESAENKYDSAPTVEQVKAHDLRYEGVCGQQN